MKPIISFALLAAIATIGSAGAAATDPVGYNTTTLYGANTLGARKNNVIGPQLENAPVWTGTVASVSGDSLTLTSAALTVGAYNKVTFDLGRYTFCIEAADGTWAHVDSNNATSVTLEPGMGSQFVAGDQVSIRPHLTVAGIFGAANETGLLANNDGDGSVADNIILVDEQYGGNIIILPSNAVGGQYITDGFAAADNFPIYPDQGIQVSRYSTGNLSLVLDGSVDVNGRQNGVPTGFSIRPVGNPVDFALGDLNLIGPTPATGLVGAAGGDASTGDTVNLLINGSTSVYFYSAEDLGSGPGWYDDSFGFADDTVIPAGLALLVYRSNPTNSSPFTWAVPAPDIN
ncbi:hypothetical protein [Luteolibacter sp. Populi]|uniref:hypothetical protein n=1 Tax=Luteolibacter sp. Populi TaxID=3230487 RepID=UPI003467ECB7